VRSALALAIHDALREAGIEIPFPQRDLHIRSVDPAILEQFKRGE
jgi:small-conductance mechanosensitive channel